MPPPASGSFRILSLSGGGFLGFYTAVVLQGLEEAAGRPLAREFDLIAGTSIGGVLALALAYEVPMQRMVRLFEEHGPRVFSTRPLPRDPVSRAVDLARAVWGPKYSGEGLRRAAEGEFGDRRLRAAKHACVIPAVEVNTSRTKVFKTPHGPHSGGDEALRAADVAVACCAAPAYFPSVPIGEHLYADGGLFATAPDQVALHEAECFLGVDIGRARMLSVGTAAARYCPSGGVRAGAGAVNSLADGRLLLTLISAQQQHVQAIMEDRLADRYLRLDAEWPRNAGLGIDVATEAAMKTLRQLAEQTLADVPPALLRHFIERRQRQESA